MSDGSRQTLNGIGTNYEVATIQEHKKLANKKNPKNSKLKKILLLSALSDKE
jgi:hypothetical protein